MRYRKKPIIVDAEQWLGPQSCPMRGVYVSTEGVSYFCVTAQRESVPINWGDWIILEAKQDGGHTVLAYPCAPDVFAATYEPTDAPH
jgi:hypothetical protein